MQIAFNVHSPKLIPLNIFLVARSPKRTSSLVHPIAMFGATFAMDRDSWPSTRPEWTRRIARALEEFRDQLDHGQFPDEDPDND